MGSSGFQHVFVGELNKHSSEGVSGLHNWIRFETLEQQGDVDYAGFLTPGNVNILKIPKISIYPLLIAVYRRNTIPMERQFENQRIHVFRNKS